MERKLTYVTREVLLEYLRSADFGEFSCCELGEISATLACGKQPAPWYNRGTLNPWKAHYAATRDEWATFWAPAEAIADRRGAWLYDVDGYNGDTCAGYRQDMARALLDNNEQDIITIRAHIRRNYLAVVRRTV